MTTSVGGPQSTSKNGDMMYWANARDMIAKLDGFSTTTDVQEKRKAGSSPIFEFSGPKAVLM